jgi:hypothetical protein
MPKRKGARARPTPRAAAPKPAPAVSRFAKHAYLAYLAGLAALPLYILHWSLNPDNYFFADDWAWLDAAVTRPVLSQLRLFPDQPYNDRPAGALFINALYHIFGLNPVGFHAVFLAVHLLNVILAFWIARRLLQSEKLAFCSALLFGCWGSALRAPTWVAAAFDLLCCTFLLLALLAHVEKKSPWLTAGLLVLALRTKEVAIVFPLLLVAHEVLSSPRWTKERIRRIVRSCGPALLVMGVYGAVYLDLHRRFPIPEANQYHITIGFGPFFWGMEFYLRSLFYLDAFHPLITAAFLMMLVGCLAMRWSAESMGLSGFVLFLLPVAFLAKQRGELYLYLPSAFFWMGVIALLRRGLLWLWESFPARTVENLAVAIALLAAIGQYWLYLPTVNWSLGQFRMFRTSADTLQRVMPSPAPNTRLFIYGLPVYMNIFDFGPCFSVRLIYKQTGMDCVIYKTPEETRKLFDAYGGPNILLSYAHGELKAME